MTEREGARERLAEIEKEAGTNKVGTGRAAVLWYRNSRWLCDQLSGFLAYDDAITRGPIGIGSDPPGRAG